MSREDKSWNKMQENGNAADCLCFANAVVKLFDVSNIKPRPFSLPEFSLFLAMDLKSKQICRFCLTTNRPLTNIYKAEIREVPLSLQIVVSVGIEVK